MANGELIDSFEVNDSLVSIEMALPRNDIQNYPSAYIVTDNRGKRYLVFAGSVEHENARMFGYTMEALYA